MWKKSKPGDYTSFRTFIFGITSQSMFPNGVLYEGVSDKPFSFRGESGANDSIVRYFSHSRLQKDMPNDPCTRNRFRYVITYSRSRCPQLPLPIFSRISAHTDPATTVSSWNGSRTEPAQSTSKNLL